MAIVKILTLPNDLLRQKCTEVKEINSEVKKDIQNILDTLRAAKEPEGAGLAASQIGVLKRIIVVRRFIPGIEDPESVTVKDYVLINPRLTKTSQETSVGWEACLSVPNTYGKVERPKKIKVEALDENGKKIQVNTSGYFARVILHEMDHMDGVMFTDKTIGKTISDEDFHKLYAEE